MLKRTAAFLLVWLLLATTALAHGGVSLADFPHALKGKHFVVLYSTTGPDAVKPDYAERTLAAAEQAYEQLVTAGGLRAPRVLPVPVVIKADEPSTGGSVAGSDLGHDLVLQMNPRMSAAFSLEDVMAHELFHVLQASYNRGGDRPVWAIEGSASAAPHYAFNQPWDAYSRAQRESMSAYYIAQHRGMKTNQYLSAPFWYWMAEQYGGVGFLHRVMTWAEHFEWEWAIQLAAIEGGAPDETTFDSLWRRFMLDLVAGQMPEPFMTRFSPKPAQLAWTGLAASLDQGKKTEGSNLLGARYSFMAPQLLPTYSYALVEVTHRSASPFDLTFIGDGRTLEAYVMKPGPAVLDALRSPPTGGPDSPDRRPPSDPDTRWAALTPGEPVRITGPANHRTLVLILRTGNWGNGAYSVGVAPGKAETPAPVWVPLEELPPGGASAGSPPPLTADELEALRTAKLMPETPDLASKVTPAEPGRKGVIQVTVGSRTARSGLDAIELPVPVIQSEDGPLFPVFALAPHLGITVSGSRLSLGNRWYEMSAGRYWSWDKGLLVPFKTTYQDGHLMASYSFAGLLGCSMSTRGEVITLTCPTGE